jgi:AcrR family transcriptional regulator
MGRPREHDEGTRTALIAAAEEIVAADGLDGLTVRAVAERAGTTTRAVYSVFGSKAGLVEALANRAFEHLADAVDEYPETDDPAADLIGMGAGVYRRFVTEHPSLFRIAFQRISPTLELSEEILATRRRSWARLEHKVRRVADAGLIAGRSVRDAAVEFNALCEGLANAELRGGTIRALETGEGKEVWDDAFATLVAGFRMDPSSDPRASKGRDERQRKQR